MAALAICAVTAALLRGRTDTQAPPPVTPDQPPDYARAVQRGLGKRAPFTSDKNSVAYALLIEIYASQISGTGGSDVYVFATSNYSAAHVVGHGAAVDDLPGHGSVCFGWVTVLRAVRDGPRRPR